MPLQADLYLDQIDLTRHTDQELGEVCRVDSLEELLDRLRSGHLASGQCPHWPRERIEAFRMAIDAGQALPVIPSLDIPRPVEPGVLDLNGADAGSPVLITGNSQFTQDVLLAVLSTATASMRLVSVDTGGHTVDMSMVFGTLTPEGIAAAIQADDPGGSASAGRVILPGLAADLAKPAADDSRAGGLAGRIILPGLADALAGPVAEILGRPVEAGPVCAAELPLFFGGDWVA